MISILRKGIDKTYDQYHRYLDGIVKKANEYFADRMDRGKNKQLAGWTTDRGLQTLKLLETSRKSNSLGKLSGSLLLVHMK